MRDALTQLAFLSLFHVIGGAVAGRSVRQAIRHGWSCNLLGSLFWGIAFGGLPILFGIAQLVGGGSLYLPLIQLLVFVGSFLVVTLTSEWVLETFDPQVFGPILFGGGFMIVGVVLFLSLVGEGWLEALVALAVFGGSGVFVLVTSVLKALRGKAL